MKNVAIIGTGLIGGSMAIALKGKNPQIKIIGVDNNVEHAKEALKLGFIDEINELPDAVE